MPHIKTSWKNVSIQNVYIQNVSVTSAVDSVSDDTWFVVNSSGFAPKNSLFHNATGNYGKSIFITSKHTVTGTNRMFDIFNFLMSKLHFFMVGKRFNSSLGAGSEFRKNFQQTLA
jgi:hypothetical protein